MNMNAVSRLAVIALLPVASFAQAGLSQEIPLQAAPNNAFPAPEILRNADDIPFFSDIWQVLGPFQVGTRGKTKSGRKDSRSR